MGYRITDSRGPFKLGNLGGLWDTTTGDLWQTLEGHSHSIWSVAFSPDGRLLASGSVDETVRLWDTATSGLQETLEGHSDSVTSVAFSPDGRLLASGSDDETVRLWDPATGSMKEILKPNATVDKLSFSPDSSYLSTNLGNLIVQSEQVNDASSSSPVLALHCPRTDNYQRRKCSMASL